MKDGKRERQGGFEPGLLPFFFGMATNSMKEKIALHVMGLLRMITSEVPLVTSLAPYR